jgi:hypothetical protein
VGDVTWLNAKVDALLSLLKCYIAWAWNWVIMGPYVSRSVQAFLSTAVVTEVTSYPIITWQDMSDLSIGNIEKNIWQEISNAM